MLKIRGNQMSALAAPQVEQFEQRLVEFLHRQFPESREESPEELRAVVREQAARAGRYGLSTEQQTAVYVTCAWLLGPDFDTQFPAAQEMLASPEYTAEDKAEWLEQWAQSVFNALEEE